MANKSFHRKSFPLRSKVSGEFHVHGGSAAVNRGADCVRNWAIARTERRKYSWLSSKDFEYSTIAHSTM